MDVTIVVPFTGPPWSDLARERAVPSALACEVPVIEVEATTVHGARNAGLARVRTEWVCHLDADDELEPGYFEAIERGTADVRAPAVRYVQGVSTRRPARMPTVAGHGAPHECSAPCLDAGNWLVVGAVVRTELARVRGWRDFRWSEDWDFWLGVRAAGATFEAIPAAVYRAHVSRSSRNRAIAQSERVMIHHQIARANGLPS